MSENLQSAIVDGTLLRFIETLDFQELESTGGLVAKMHNDGLVDALRALSDLKAIELEDYRSVMRLDYIVGGFAGSVRGELPTILSFFHNMSARLGQSNQHKLQKGVETWLSNNSEQVQETVSLMHSFSGESLFFGAALKVWREISSAEAIATSLDLSNDSRPLVKRQAIYALSGFAHADDHARLAAASGLARLIDGDDLDGRIAAIASAAAMISDMPDRPDDLMAALERACQDPTPEIRHQLIFGWAFKSGGYPERLREHIIRLMKETGVDSPSTLNVIDTALSHMDRDVIYDVLTAILTNGDNSPSLKMFGSTLYKIQSSDGGELAWFAVKWLLEGHYAICPEIHRLFPVSEQRLYDIDITVFKLEPTKVLYLSRKIFGYLTHYHSPAVSLLYACLSTLDVKNRRSLEENIASFWLRNFPDDLSVFEKLLNSYVRQGMDASIKRLAKLVDAYDRPLRKLPKNPALRPSTAERRVQAEIARDQSAEIRKSADKGSILSSLFHKSTLLYGRSSITYIYNGADEPIRQVVALKSFEASSTLPRMYGMYPARLSYMVFRFRSEKCPK